MSELKILKGLDVNLPSSSERDENAFYVTTDTGKLILGSNLWQANLSLDTVELSSARTDSNYVLYMNGKEIFSVPIMMWDIEYNIIGCSLSDQNVVIEHGHDYTSTITSNGDDFQFKSCSIIVGGVDRTTSCFDSTKMKITIPNVKANIIISIEFEQISDAVGVITNNEIYLYEDKLPSGTYALYYEDENNDILDSFGMITDEATI